MTVKAKFRCSQVVDTNFGNDNTQRQVIFFPVYGKDGENADYSKATPTGELKMVIDKSTPAYEGFAAGKEYYLTFDEA